MEGMHDVEEYNDDEEPSLPKAGRRRRKLAAKKRGRLGIGSSEAGDDCERDSDLMETDSSDDGADLQDFIVSDRVVITSGEPSSSSGSAATRRDRRLSTSPTSVTGPFSPSPPRWASKATNGRPSRSSFAGMQATDDESLPALSQLLKNKNNNKGKGGGRGQRRAASSDEDEDGSPRPRPNRGRRRVAMYDSEDEL